MTKIILNADDFGYCEAVNYGIIKVHQEGLYKSTTMMSNMDGAVHAAKLAKENPDLFVGLHVNITLGKPVAMIEDVADLVGSDGYFNVKERLAKGERLNPIHVEAEVRAQFNRFIELMNYRPLHIEAHVVTDVAMQDAIAKVALEEKVHFTDVSFSFDENGLKVVTDKYRAGYRIPAFPTNMYFKEFVSYDYWEQDLGEILKHSLVQVHSHPGYIDQFLLDNSSYNVTRALEVEIGCSARFKKWVSDNDVEIISYADLIEEH